MMVREIKAGMYVPQKAPETSRINLKAKIKLKEKRLWNKYFDFDNIESNNNTLTKIINKKMWYDFTMMYK